MMSAMESLSKGGKLSASECNDHGFSVRNGGCSLSVGGVPPSLITMLLFVSASFILCVSAVITYYRRGRRRRQQGERTMRLVRDEDQGPVGTPVSVLNMLSRQKYLPLNTGNNSGKDDEVADSSSVDLHKFIQDDSPSCSICICELEKGEEIMILPCNHVFHAECIETWLKQSVRCPLCNGSVVESSKKYLVQDS